MNKFINIGILLLLVLFISFRINVACNQLDKKPAVEKSNLAIPSTHETVLPCASCPGIEYSLTLNEDLFLEKNIYIDRAEQPVQIVGVWEVRSDTLILINDKDLIHKRFIIANDSLTLLDNEGDPIILLNMAVKTGDS